MKFQTLPPNPSIPSAESPLSELPPLNRDPLPSLPYPTKHLSAAICLSAPCLLFKLFN